tara:strand:+ start:116 stop:352 length:237 start_codon:yes stop_codon:yes gene_type:complete
MALNDEQKERLRILMANKAAIEEEIKTFEDKVITLRAVVDNFHLLSDEDLYEIWEYLDDDVDDQDDDDVGGYSGGDGD